MRYCRCIIVWLHPNYFGDHWQLCRQEVNNDQPFCDHCEDRHPDHTDIDAVTALPLHITHPQERRQWHELAQRSPSQA